MRDMAFAITCTQPATCRVGNFRFLWGAAVTFLQARPQSFEVFRPQIPIHTTLAPESGLVQYAEFLLDKILVCDSLPGSFGLN